VRVAANRLALSTVGLAASALLIWINIDINSVAALLASARPTLLPVAVFIMLMIVVAFAWRWRTLLCDEVAQGDAGRVTAIGLAANQLLPLRGGDALRVALSARVCGLHRSVSALAVEKVLDLMAVAALGLAVLAVTRGSVHPALASSVLLICAGTFTAAALLVMSARFRPLRNLVQRLSRATRLPCHWYRHWARLRRAAAQALAHRPVAMCLQTIVIWFVLYAMIYAAIGLLVGVELSATDIAVLMFAGAIGLALPGAPSGLGTYHAAVASAFVLLDRPFSEGLAVAVAAHAVFFVSLCGIGLLAVIVRQSNGEQPSTAST
jgi:uncharacterized protein (TIRG00374 family)